MRAASRRREKRERERLVVMSAGLDVVLVLRQAHGWELTAARNKKNTPWMLISLNQRFSFSICHYY